MQVDDREPEISSIHNADFSAEWRWNVLRSYSSQSVALPTTIPNTHRLRIYLFDLGVVLQEIRVEKKYK